MSNAVRLLPLAYGWMPNASLRIGVEAEPADEDAEAGAERDDDAEVGVERDEDAEAGAERDVAKPSLRGGTLAIGRGGGAFLQDWRGGMQLTSPSGSAEATHAAATAAKTNFGEKASQAWQPPKRGVPRVESQAWSPKRGVPGARGT